MHVRVCSVQGRTCSIQGRNCNMQGRGFSMQGRAWSMQGSICSMQDRAWSTQGRVCSMLSGGRNHKKEILKVWTENQLLKVGFYRLTEAWVHPHSQVAHAGTHAQGEKSANTNLVWVSTVSQLNEQNRISVYLTMTFRPFTPEKNWLYFGNGDVTVLFSVSAAMTKHSDQKRKKRFIWVTLLGHHLSLKEDRAGNEAEILGKPSLLVCSLAISLAHKTQLAFLSSLGPPRDDAACSRQPRQHPRHSHRLIW